MPQSARSIFEQVCQTLTPLYGQTEASSQAFWLMEEWFGLPKTEVLLDRRLELTPDQHNQLKEGLLRLSNHEPIQYVLGKAYFLNRAFAVNNSVLSPRQETEELVLWIKNSHPEESRILDIGCGSGCISVSLALEMKGSKVAAWDVSEGALRVTQENAQRLQGPVTTSRVDILGYQPSPPSLNGFDIVVSNPPYVTRREKSTMDRNVTEHEPAIALFVEDDDPLLFYRKICERGPFLLTPGGWLYFEINQQFGTEVVRLMKESGYVEVELRKDMNGKERMVRGRVGK